MRSEHRANTEDDTEESTEVEACMKVACEKRNEEGGCATRQKAPMGLSDQRERAESGTRESISGQEQRETMMERQRETYWKSSRKAL